MKPLNEMEKEKEWEEFQNLVKESPEKKQRNILGVSFYVAEFYIDKNGKIIKREK